MIKVIDIDNGVKFAVDGMDLSVTTVYPDGAKSYAQRLATEENINEADDEGYRGDYWDALIDHELLHTVCSRLLWDQESQVIRHAAGVAKVRYGMRLWEEAVILGVQYWLNTGTIDPAIRPFMAALTTIRRQLMKYKSQL